MDTKDIEATLQRSMSQDKSVKEMSRDLMVMFTEYLDGSKPGYNGKPCINKPRDSFLRPSQPRKGMRQ